MVTNTVPQCAGWVEFSLLRYRDVLQSDGRYAAVTIPVVVQPNRQRLAHRCSCDDPPSPEVDYDRSILSVERVSFVYLKQCRFVIVTLL